MAEKPLLLFPRLEKASRSKLGSGPQKITVPAHTRQGQRLSPLFQRLRDAFDKRRVEILRSNAGLDPEQIIVIETIGDIEKFIKAVSKIDGLEWMGELSIDEIAPDDDFHDPARQNKLLSGKLYMLMSNQRALEELLALWENYQKNPNYKFARGLTKFRDVFDTLKDIRRWDVKDRLLETGIIERWKENLQIDPNAEIFFEAELWYRSDTKARTRDETYVANLITSIGGQIVQRCHIPEIAYHTILGKLPSDKIQEIISNPATELVKCDNIMFFRATGQVSVIGTEPEGSDSDESPTAIEEPVPDQDPVVAIFDGLPMENHPLLQNRLSIDDPDNFSSAYQVQDRVHGTIMSSLIIHGDLSENLTPTSRKVYLRPVLQPQPTFTGRAIEVIPKNSIATDIIHRAVRRLYEGENGNAPVCDTIKIINLSIGDPGRPFTREMSPLARLIDWLSAKYRVLFIISAGNQTEPIQLPFNGTQLTNATPEEIEEAVILSTYDNRRLRRILSPAESINALTVGASHFDNSTAPQNQNVIDPFTKLLPSPVTSLGNGYRKSIKPEVIFKGGRQLFTRPVMMNSAVELVPRNYTNAPGIKSAYPESVARQGGSYAFSRGTSNSAALVSREAMICYDLLSSLLAENGRAQDAGPAISALVKTMIVHGCTWSESAENLKSILERSPIGTNLAARMAALYSKPHTQRQEYNRHLGRIITSWLGYGIPAPERIAECTDQRVSLLGYGSLMDDEAHVYKLPLPPSLDLKREWRRLIVTLGWFSPIQCKNQKYRNASLWFETFNNGITPDRTDAQWQTVKNGTLQHEVFEGDVATHFSDGESLEIKVNCREDAGKIETPIIYGLAVTLEVADGSAIKIYDEVKTRLRIPVAIRQAT